MGLGGVISLIAWLFVLKSYHKYASEIWNFQDDLQTQNTEINFENDGSIMIDMALSRDQT